MSFKNTRQWSEIASSCSENKYNPASSKGRFSDLSSSSNRMQTPLKCTWMFSFLCLSLCSSLTRWLQAEPSGRYGGSGWAGRAGVPTAPRAPGTDHLVEKGSRPRRRPRRAHHGKSCIQSQVSFWHVAFLTTWRTTGLPRYFALASSVHLVKGS